MKLGPVYERTPAALWRRAGAEVVLTTPERADVDVLSLPASTAWLLLDRPRTLSEITDGLADEFAVGRAEIEARVVGLVAELEAAGWLVRTGDA